LMTLRGGGVSVRRPSLLLLLLLLSTESEWMSLEG
jgi:hypothetical protein